MNKYVFVGRVEDGGRDGCFYVEKELHKNIADNVIIHGARWCGYFEEYKKAIEDDQVKSYLTKEELLELINGINYDQHIEKLQSEEAKEFQNTIIEEEKEWVMDEYDLSREDVDCIFDEYYLDYQDRGIVGTIYNNKEELGEEEISNGGYFSNFPSDLAQFFDFEAYGDHLVNYGDCYLELPSGKCAYLNY
jgi:hypothetical protein